MLFNDRVIKGFFLIFVSFSLVLLPLNHVAGDSLRGGGNTWFVSVTGAGTDCSQSNPGPLKYCVEDKASSGDKIYVKEGTYQPTIPADNLLDITKSLHLIGSCTWTPTGPIECHPQDELPFVTPSYLDGNNQKRVIAIEGSGISVTIEGFHIVRGNADSKSPNPAGVLGAGGGIYANGIHSLMVQNNYIWANQANATGMTDSDYGYGGGIYASHIGHVVISENTIIFNEASPITSTGVGGGLCVEASGENGGVQITSNRIHENMVGNNNFSTAAGASLLNNEDLILSDNVFEYHNDTIRHDWISGSALTVAIASAGSRVDHNIFKENYGSSIVSISGFYGTFSGNEFWDNDSAYDLKIQNGNDIQLINNFFGKMYGWTPTALPGSNNSRGGISTLVHIAEGCGEPVVDIINNTFGYAEYAVQVNDLLEVEIRRNIFTSHSKKAIDIMNPANMNVTVSENLFWDNADNGETGVIFWSSDPLMVSPLTGDFHLQAGSPAVDRVSVGSVLEDIDRQNRPMGYAVDLGADELEDDRYFFLPLILH